MARRRFRGAYGDGPGYWPAFVDVLSNILLVTLFLLFLFFLGTVLSGRSDGGKDDAFAALQAKISELTDLLALRETEKSALEAQVAQMKATLDAEAARANDAEARIIVLVGDIEKGRTGTEEANARIATLETEIESEKAISADALSKLELLNQEIAALKEQIATLEKALAAADARNKENEAQIVDLGNRLQAALDAQKKELDAYRSDFFAELKKALGDREDITVVGDRFILPTEILFGPGSAALNEAGKAELKKVARVLREIEGKIPKDVKWILRVDGHTDRTPITSSEFPTNWHLSLARSLTVVQFLIAEGVAPKRLVPAGFGEYHPLDPGSTPAAFARNRRIEFKLTDG